MKEIVTFLTFDGNCREAMEFYKRCFEAELHLLPFSEAPCDLPAEARQSDRIIHATLTKGFTILMASDAVPGAPFQPGDNFAVTVQCESLAEIERLFAALSEGGRVTMALQDTFWDARFGTLTDRFGVPWMFNFAHPKQG